MYRTVHARRVLTVVRGFHFLRSQCDDLSDTNPPNSAMPHFTGLEKKRGGSGTLGVRLTATSNPSFTFSELTPAP